MNILYLKSNVVPLRLCVLDYEVLIVPAVENPIEAKDNWIIRKFKQAYPEKYVICDEKIDKNLFQVFGVKAEKVDEIYAQINYSKLDVLIPYGVALRNTLLSHKLLTTDSLIVFVDLVNEDYLITFFNGNKLSKTRVFQKAKEDLLSEIKRTHIDFCKKNQEFVNNHDSPITVFTNDKDLAQSFGSKAENFPFEYVDLKNPAIDGLELSEPCIYFKKLENTLKTRQQIEIKNRLRAFVLSVLMIGFGIAFAFVNGLRLNTTKANHIRANEQLTELNKQLSDLDKYVYREELKHHKDFNYGVVYLSILDLIPSSYTVTSLKIHKDTSWNYELSLTADDQDLYDPIPRIRILKNAEIKNVFANNRPAKHIKVLL